MRLPVVGPYMLRVTLCLTERYQDLSSGMHRTILKQNADLQKYRKVVSKLWK